MANLSAFLSNGIEMVAFAPTAWICSPYSLGHPAHAKQQLNFRALDFHGCS